MGTASEVTLETIDALAAEHVEVMRLLGEVATAVAAGDVVRATGRLLEGSPLLTAGLDDHIRVEDQSLFPAIAGDLGSGLVAVFAEEHVTIRSLRDEVIASLATPPLAAGACEALHDLLASHTAREDGMLFPAARDVLARHADAAR